MGSVVLAAHTTQWSGAVILDCVTFYQTVYSISKFFILSMLDGFLSIKYKKSRVILLSLVASNPSSHPPIILTHNFVFLFAHFHYGSSNCTFFNFFETFLKSLRNFFWFLKICCFLLFFTNVQKKVASNLSFFFVARYLPVDPSIIQTNDILW